MLSVSLNSEEGITEDHLDLQVNPNDSIDVLCEYFGQLKAFPMIEFSEEFNIEVDLLNLPSFKEIGAIDGSKIVLRRDIQKEKETDIELKDIVSGPRGRQRDPDFEWNRDFMNSKMKLIDDGKTVTGYTTSQWWTAQLVPCVSY